MTRAGITLQSMAAIEQRLDEELAANRTAAGFIYILGSVYGQALRCINTLCELEQYKAYANRGNTIRMRIGADGKAYTALELLEVCVLYYFATHTDVDPLGRDEMPDTEQAELQRLFAHMVELYERNQIDDEQAFITAFVEVDRARVITGTFTRALAITDKDYQFALTPYQNRTAFVAQFDEQFMKRMKFRNGRLCFDDEETGKQVWEQMAAQNAKYLDIQLLSTLYTAIVENVQRIQGDDITVYLPDFCKSMGIDIQKGNANDIFGKIHQFQNCVGYTEDGSFYALLNFQKYNKQQNTITFSSPYLIVLKNKIYEHNLRTNKRGEEYLKPAYSLLIHSDIMCERNKAAVEIARRIIVLLQQRGSYQSKTKKHAEYITTHKKFSAIVDETPILRDKLQSGHTADNNKFLKRAFEKAYELLRNDTDVYKYYLELKIPNIIPTTSTLDETLKITHKGVNPNYTAVK